MSPPPVPAPSLLDLALDPSRLLALVEQLWRDAYPPGEMREGWKAVQELAKLAHDAMPALVRRLIAAEDEVQRLRDVLPPSFRPSCEGGLSP